MPDKFISLYDEEQKKNARQSELAVYQNILGADNVPGRLIHGGMVKVRNITPHDLLKDAGYILIANGSYIRRFDKDYRYHAYILPDNKIELHTDKFKIRNGKSFHVASTFLVKEEKKRIRKFIPILPPAEMSKKKRYRTEVLPREKMLEALAKIKAENEAI